MRSIWNIRSWRSFMWVWISLRRNSMRKPKACLGLVFPAQIPEWRTWKSFITLGQFLHCCWSTTRERRFLARAGMMFIVWGRMLLLRSGKSSKINKSLNIDWFIDWLVVILVRYICIRILIKNTFIYIMFLPII